MQSKDEFKIIIIGDSGVGKTTFIKRFLNKGNYADSDSTIGADMEKVEISVGDQKVPLQIWDTAGQERYKSIVNAFYRNSDAVIVMYDTHNRSSFISAESWVEVVRKHCSSIPVILVGSKCDGLDKVEVSIDEAERFAQSYGLASFRSSAYENINVEKVFEHITSCMLQNPSSRKGSTLALKAKRSSRVCC